MKKEEGLIIVIDTREQTPWEFEGASERGTLSTGDYSVKGLERQVAIERKSLPDLIGSLTAGRERFMREIERLKEFRFKAIIVEGSAEDVWGSNYRSSVNPRSIIASTLAITCQHGVPVIWAGNRKHGAWCAQWLLNRAWGKRDELGLDTIGLAAAAVEMAVATNSTRKVRKSKRASLDTDSINASAGARNA